jgi:two-component system chemotaxis response regulator CheY
MDLNNLRILCVDDHETVRVLFLKCLNDLGVENILEADNGKTALQELQSAQRAQRPFHMVFCDWNMPIMNGLELLLTVRNDPDLKDTPFVMVTVNSDESEVIAAMRAGVSEYIVKPFDSKSLLRTIERLLSSKKRAN